jgi:hypothetical protein
VFFEFSRVVTTKWGKYVEFDNIKNTSGKPTRKLIKYTYDLRPCCNSPRRGYKYFYKGEKGDLEYINKKKCDNCNETTYYERIYIHFKCGIEGCEKEFKTEQQGITTIYHCKLHTHFTCDRCTLKVRGNDILKFNCPYILKYY